MTFEQVLQQNISKCKNTKCGQRLRVIWSKNHLADRHLAKDNVQNVDHITGALECRPTVKSVRRQNDFRPKDVEPAAGADSVEHSTFPD